jgi:hypothetical protein
MSRLFGYDEPAPAAPGEKKGEPASKTSEPQLYRHFVLHVLRNPWGVAEETIRKVRLDAADIIEQLEQELAVAREVANRETLSAAYWKDKASAVSATAPLPAEIVEAVQSAITSAQVGELAGWEIDLIERRICSHAYKLRTADNRSPQEGKDV